jgi:site-specific recombinase XerD
MRCRGYRLPPDWRWEVDEKTGKLKPIPLETISKATITDYVEDRREEDRSTSTILNDMTAWNHVMAYASNKGWIEDKPVRSIERLKLVGQRRTSVSPPTDPQVAELIDEVAE